MFRIFAMRKRKTRRRHTSACVKYEALTRRTSDKNMDQKEAITRLHEHGIKPSVQRIAIMQYLLTHFTHPTVDDVYRGLCSKIPTLSRTTVYNTLRLFAEHNAAQMITIDDHRVCYDGNMSAHAHFYCNKCRRVYDVFDEISSLLERKSIDGHVISDAQLYYRGVCRECAEAEQNANN